MQQELRRAGKRRQRQQQRRQRHHRHPAELHTRIGADPCEQFRQLSGSIAMPQQQRRAHQRQIAHAIGQKRPQRIAAAGFATGVEAEQKEQQHPNQEPGDQQRDQIGGDNHQQDHGRHQVKLGKKPHVTGLVGHVAHRIDMHHQADSRHQHRHRHREMVEQQNRRPELSQGDLALRRAQHCHQHRQRDSAGDSGHRHADAHRLCRPTGSG